MASKYRIKTLYATAAELAAENPILLEGEPGTESDTGRQKTGDGVTAWLSLPYSKGGREKPARFAVTSPDTEVKFGYVLEVGGTISKITSAVLGSDTPSATFSIRYGSDMEQPGTEVVVGGIVCSGPNVLTTAFDSPAVMGGDWLWCEVTAVSGTIASLSVSVEF